MNPELQFVPEAASRSATETDLLSLTLLGVVTLFSLGIALAIVYFVARYWHTRETDRHVRATKAMFWAVEITWSVVPLIIALLIFWWGARLYMRRQQPPDSAIQISVVAKQWMWKIGHASGPREINTLHVPAGRPVRLTMISEDVIHSFYVPAFRTKQDVLPGRYMTLWFEATRPGNYHLFCAEFCGTDHARMIGTVVVQTPEDHAAWLAEQNAMTAAQRGSLLIERSGCLQCHGPEGNGSGPPLAGLYGRPVLLSSGERVIADESYIRRSILTPQAQVHAGFQPVMPTFEGKLEPEEILDIIAHLRSIADASERSRGPGIQTGPLDSPGDTPPAQTGPTPETGDN